MLANDVSKAVELIIQLMKDSMVKDLQETMRETMREEFKAKHALELEAKLLSPSEACKIFEKPISIVTLAAWTKAGYLKDYRIGRRKYYRAAEVIEAAKHLKRYQHRP